MSLQFPLLFKTVEWQKVKQKGELLREDRNSRFLSHFFALAIFLDTVGGSGDDHLKRESTFYIRHCVNKRQECKNWEEDEVTKVLVSVCCTATLAKFRCRL